MTDCVRTSICDSLLIGKPLDKHAPLKKTSRKREKEKIKPWVTREIRHSMKIRDMLYKQFFKSKNNQTREIKQAGFKKYRNKITDLLRISRQSHYQKYFSDNKKKSKALWQGIHKIIYSKKVGKTNSPSSLLINQKSVTNQQDIAEQFNISFTSIGKNLQEIIPPTRKDYAQYLKPQTKIIFQ